MQWWSSGSKKRGREMSIFCSNCILYPHRTFKNCLNNKYFHKIEGVSPSKSISENGTEWAAQLANMGHNIFLIVGYRKPN
jgi:hypothetical protein